MFFNLASIYLSICIFVLPITVGASQEETKEDETNDQHTDAIFPRTDPATIGELYRMLEVLDTVLTNHNIPYWIDAGTALGAVRHGGIIPWDDDVDVGYHIENEDRVLALTDEFAEYGFHLMQVDILKILRLFPSEINLYPCIDLIGFKLHEDQIFRFDLRVARLLFPNFYWLPSEIDPLVRIPFGPITVNAANEMTRYIFSGYGSDCLTHATFQKQHGGKSKERIIKKKVEIIDFTPAEYTFE